MESLLRSLLSLCPSWDYSALISIYFTAKLIIAYTTDGNYNTTFSSIALQRALKQWNMWHWMSELRLL